MYFLFNFKQFLHFSTGMDFYDHRFTYNKLDLKTNIQSRLLSVPELDMHMII